MSQQTLSLGLVRKAETHLNRIDPVMSCLLSKHGRCMLYQSPGHPFETLVRSIIGQQLSAKAAATIAHRVLLIVGTFTPSSFLAVSTQTLREAGLSASKVRFICELSKRSTDGRVSLNSVASLTDDEVLEHLMQVPGVGRWTAEMFLIFGLRRPDVLALGDAGLHRATRLLYGDTANLSDVSQLWRPYRSVASWYLWRHLDAA